MEALLEALSSKLQQWKPETAMQVPERVGEIQEVREILDEPPHR